MMHHIKNNNYVVHSLQICIAMTALNLSICHPTGIQRQYMPSTTMYYNRHKQRINISPSAAPQQSEGAQMVKNQTILVGGVYHWRYKPPPDTTTTNLPAKGLAISV